MDSSAAGGQNLLVACVVALYAAGFIVHAYIFGLIGRWLGRKRGEARRGFWLAFCLGWLGCLIIVVFYRKQERIVTAGIYEPDLNAAQIAAINARFRVPTAYRAGLDRDAWGDDDFVP